MITPPSVNFVAAFIAGVIVAAAMFYFTRRPRPGGPPLPDDLGYSVAGGGEFPRIYPVTPAWKAGIVTVAGILVLGSLAAAWEFGVVAAETRDAPLGLILVFFLAAAASGAAIYIADTFVSAVVLKSDRLEIHELWRVRRVLRADIETQRVLRPPNSPPVLMLRLNAPGTRKLKLTVLWKTDDAWKSWFAAIPDVDVEAAKAFAAAIDANAELGSTPAERQQRLAAARALARYAIWANLGLYVWAYLYPRPYELVILVLAVVPWAAILIMARSPGLYTFNAPRNSGRPDLTILLISPGLLLMLRAMFDVQILDWHRLLPWAALVTLALICSMLWAVPSAREKPGMAALTLIFVMAYGYGVTALGNAVLDHSTGSSYPTKVYGKYLTSGRNQSSKLRLGPWGPRSTQDDVTVSRNFYRATSVGDTVCAILHPGAFDVPWYRIDQCGRRIEIVQPAATQ